MGENNYYGGNRYNNQGQNQGNGTGTGAGNDSFKKSSNFRTPYNEN